MNKQQFSQNHPELSEAVVAQMRLLHSQGQTPDKIAAMFGVSSDMLGFLEDVQASKGDSVKLRRRRLSRVVTK